MAEILVVNGIGVCLMAVLLLIRIDRGEKSLTANRIFDAMVWITLMGCVVETGTFLIDGKVFPGAVPLAYLMNSLCFAGTCCVGFLWCCFIELKTFNSMKRLKKRLKILIIPFAVNVILLFTNLSGYGIMFVISDDNVYSRSPLVICSYVALFIYFIYSIAIVFKARRRGVHFRFLPVCGFVIPCMIGTIVQGSFYGITIGWTSVAMAMTFVYIEDQSRNSFIDSLSGLYNRSYLNYVLRRSDCIDRRIYGIMMDVNGFKQINDNYGHTKGDEAIKIVSGLLSEVVEEKSTVIRFAGDEFVILLYDDDARKVGATLEAIDAKVEEFNSTGREPYRISLAVGTDVFNGTPEDIEGFISRMDRAMYKDKEKYYRSINE